MTKGYRRDGAGHPIPGGSSIAGIVNQSVSSSVWETVKLPSDGSDCKAILCKLRSGNPWKLRRVGMTNYVTITENLSLDIALQAGENIGQVQAASGTDTFEVMLLD
jgi:hypothetical protein